MKPLVLFRRVAIAEAITWALLLTGMFLKYVTETTELGVRVFGMVHGVVFVSYGLIALVVAVDQRWTASRTLLALGSAVPPFMTVWFDRHLERTADRAAPWRLTAEQPSRLVERPVSWLLRHPGPGAAAVVTAVVVLTGAALAVGPPGS